MPIKAAEAKKVRICWDSCVFIHRIQRTADRISILEQVSYAAESDKIVLVTSALSIAEVAKLDHKKPLSAKEEKAIKEFFENDFIELVTVDRFVGELARTIVRDHRLKPGDAVIVASAILGEASMLHTYDENVLKRDGLIGNPPLKIEKPRLPTEQPIFFAGQK